MTTSSKDKDKPKKDYEHYGEQKGVAPTEAAKQDKPHPYEEKQPDDIASQPGEPQREVKQPEEGKFDHEMRHMTDRRELEHNYHAPDKSDEGQKALLSDEEAQKAGTVSGKVSRGADVYGPGPAQVPFHKLEERRR
jgi:hypothetical protein